TAGLRHKVSNTDHHSLIHIHLNSLTMKNALAMVALLFLAISSSGQDTTYRIRITDRSQITGYSGGVPQFVDAGINTIFANYTISHFAKSYPFSNRSRMHEYYTVKCDTLGLGEDLHAYDSVLF